MGFAVFANPRVYIKKIVSSAFLKKLLYPLPICLILDHEKKVIESGKLYYQKDRQPKRDWYSGKYVFCRRCSWDQFIGIRAPYLSDRVETRN